MQLLAVAPGINRDISSQSRCVWVVMQVQVLSGSKFRPAAYSGRPATQVGGYRLHSNFFSADYF